MPINNTKSSPRCQLYPLVLYFLEPFEYKGIKIVQYSFLEGPIQKLGQLCDSNSPAFKLECGDTQKNKNTKRGKMI